MGWTNMKQSQRQDKPHRMVPVTEVLEQRRREGPRSRPEYARFRLGLMQRVLDQQLKPLDVARELEAAADRFYEIDVDECRLLRHWDQRWGGLPA